MDIYERVPEQRDCPARMFVKVMVTLLAEDIPFIPCFVTGRADSPLTSKRARLPLQAQLALTGSVATLAP